jgi:predicted kinase
MLQCEVLSMRHITTQLHISETLTVKDTKQIFEFYISVSAQKLEGGEETFWEGTCVLKKKKTPRDYCLRILVPQCPTGGP